MGEVGGELDWGRSVFGGGEGGGVEDVAGADDLGHHHVEVCVGEV